MSKNSGGGAYLIIHICYVHHKSYVILEVVLHYPSNNIRTDIISRMSQMGVIIHGRATGIPRDFSILQINRYKSILPLCEGVEDPQLGQIRVRRWLWWRLPGWLLSGSRHASYCIDLSQRRREPEQCAQFRRFGECRWEELEMGHQLTDTRLPTILTQVAPKK